MPLDVTGQLKSNPLVNTGRRYCPMASDLVLPTCLKLSSSSVLSSSEEKNQDRLSRGSGASVENCDGGNPSCLHIFTVIFLSCHSDVFMFHTRSVSKPASVIRENI